MAGAAHYGLRFCPYRHAAWPELPMTVRECLFVSPLRGMVDTIPAWRRPLGLHTFLKAVGRHRLQLVKLLLLQQIRNRGSRTAWSQSR